MRLTDQEFEALKGSLNNAIHEIVFTCKHMEDDQIEDAAQALITAQTILERVGDELVQQGA